MLTNLVALAIRFLLWLRYDIRTRGLEHVQERKGILFLPNHPAELDPVTLMSLLWGRFRPHPLVTETFFYMPGVHLLMKLVGAVPMPNTETGIGPYKRKRIHEGLLRVTARLAAGENVLLYPSGRLMRGPTEEIRAASAVHELLQREPDTRVVLVRTRGFLGSSFSAVARHQTPELGPALLHGLKVLLLNGVFFTPRRRIEITFEPAPADLPRHADKLTLNRWLEDWYNEPGPESPTYTRWYFWSQAHLPPPPPPQESTVDTSGVDPEIKGRVLAELARVTGRDAAELSERSNLAGDLAMDSLDLADLVAWLQEEFLAGDVDPVDLQTAADVMAAAAGQLKQEAGYDTVRLPKGWEEPVRPGLAVPAEADNVALAFLRQCERAPRAVFMADETSGVLTYNRAKIGVLLLAEVIAELPEERVGIMLPATVGSTVCVLATLVAGKVPVMINWTLGDANFRHVVETAELRTILTSERFLDRLETLDFDYLSPFLLTLEELRLKRFGWLSKLRAAWAARGSADKLGALHGAANRRLDEPCVILFTSGSESAPKGVPLSHQNVLSNIRGALQSGVLDDEDCLYGFLPPFHSFGFTIATILPAVSGLKVCYYPNPTQSRKLAGGIALWQPSIICGTPTFVAGICRAALPGQLDSLRLVVTGAEKTPDELVETVRKLCGAELLEGYGITETAPVLTLCRPGERIGVGRPLGDARILIVDPETHEPLPVGQRGLILARGSNVFKGYLGRDSRDAFCEARGEYWYLTGDLGFVDEQGNLTLAGRLKRFVKVGGEMVSLPAMEAALSAKYPSEEGPNLAIAYVERDSERPVLCLYTTFPITLDEANAVLKDAGFSNLARLTRADQLAEIPLLGTGKTDYQTLTRRLQDSLAS